MAKRKRSAIYDTVKLSTWARFKTKTGIDIEAKPRYRSAYDVGCALVDAASIDGKVFARQVVSAIRSDDGNVRDGAELALRVAGNVLHRNRLSRDASD